MSYETLTDKLLKGKKDKFFVSIVPVSIDGAILLGKRTEDGIWTTPGGGADPGEAPEKAAKRELFEEAGLVCGPNDLELVNVGETPRGFKIYSFLWRMPRGTAEFATSKLDPDKEVKSWKLYRPEDFPAAMQSEQNASRLTTIREALMMYYGVNKADAQVLSLVDKLNKGGPGSGQKGHVTAQQPSALHPHVHADPAKPTNKLQAHLTALEHGGVIPGMKTQSGKPIVTNMDQARAQQYDVQDHIDAMNAHYELAQKTQAMLEKLKTAGHKIPPEGAKIARFHEKKMKEHMKAREYLENRKTHTAEAIKEKKANAVASVKKSVSQMGGGVGDRDLGTGDFAQTNSQADAEWMERLYSGMEGFQFADEPRSFDCESGRILLSKVDDGLYSGAFTKVDPSGLEDHARVRIERMTIPELVQFMIAQEWIKNHKVEESQQPDPTPVNPVPTSGEMYAHEMDRVAGQIEQQERAADYAALQTALSRPDEVPPGGPMDRKIQMLTLISKLLS